MGGQRAGCETVPFKSQNEEYVIQGNQHLSFEYTLEALAFQIFNSVFFFREEASGVC